MIENNNEKAKENILKGVNKKIKIRGVRIAFISCIICLVIAGIIYFQFFVIQKPISENLFNGTEIIYENGYGKILNVDKFSDVKVDLKLETINEVDKRELPYNHLYIPIKESLLFSLKTNGHFHIKNNTDNTATLYFYMSETLVQKNYCNDSFGWYVDVLVTPDLCKTDEFINEITKVYYLVYDYDNFNEQEFQNNKTKAVLLWEK